MKSESQIRMVLLMSVIFLSITCSGQELLNQLQGQWISEADLSHIILVADSAWTFSEHGNDKAFKIIETRKWIDEDNGQAPVINEEVILEAQDERILIRIDCACGNQLFLSGERFRNGAIYKKLDKTNAHE